MKTKKRIAACKVFVRVKKWVTNQLSDLPVPDFNQQYDETIL